MSPCITELQKQIRSLFTQWVTAFGCEKGTLPSQTVFAPVDRGMATVNFYLIEPVTLLADASAIFSQIIDEHIRTKASSIYLSFDAPDKNSILYDTVFNYTVACQTVGTNQRTVIRVIESIAITPTHTVLTFTSSFLGLLGID